MTLNFTRIGRTHSAPSLTIPDTEDAANVERAVLEHARPFLMSSNVEVEAVFDDGGACRGAIFCGGRVGGEFISTPVKDIH